MSRPGGRGRPTLFARGRWRGWWCMRPAAGGRAWGWGCEGRGGSRGRKKAIFNVLLRDINEILQTEVNFMVLSHHRNVIIITILQASLRFMRAPTSTQMTTMTEAWITTPHLPIPLYYPHLTFLLVYFPSCYLPYATNLTPASNATASCSSYYILDYTGHRPWPWLWPWLWSWLWLPYHGTWSWLSSDCARHVCWHISATPPTSKQSPSIVTWSTLLHMHVVIART